MKKILPIMFILFYGTPLFAQDYYEQFKTQLEKGDSAEQRTILEKWKPSGENNPEFYTASFNYYFHAGKQSVLSFSDQPKGENSLVVTDSLGRKKYMVQQEIYLDYEISQAHKMIDIGIKKFPTRLDMRFGKIYALGLTEDYKSFTAEILKTINYSKQINEQWLWEYGKPKENAKAFFLESTYSYMTQLYNTMDDDLLPNIQQIGIKLNEHYPDYIPVLSMLGVTYILAKDYENSIQYFTKAHKLAPKDYIVLSNLAESYKRKGDETNAKKYYKLTLKYGDEQAKEIARRGLKEIEE